MLKTSGLCSGSMCSDMVGDVLLAKTNLPDGRKVHRRAGSGLTQASRRSFSRRGSFETLARGTLGQLSGIEDDWELEPEPDHCGSKFVMYEGSMFRRIWNVVVALLLVYTATIFLYRLIFVEMYILNVHLNTKQRDGWTAFDDYLVNVLFWFDLFVNFLFTFQDPYGREVDSLRLIAKEYLTGFFWINLLACVPPSLTEMVLRQMLSSLDGINGGAVGNIPQVVRITRIQRASRLARLLRLGRLARLVHQKQRNSPLWNWFQSLRGVRIINFVVGLMLAVHFLACGWYLCAALHDDPQETWVARRSVNADGDRSLIDQDSFEQWFHAMYFVLTVFTTVGFGDMSAMTMGEIAYVALTMVVGAVVHSIIISHVITVVTSQDRTEIFVQQQQELVEAFAVHAELDVESRRHLRDWITFSARNWMSHRFDQEEMKQLITCNFLPRWLLGRLPQHLFQEQLIRSRFLAPQPWVEHVPPRLPLLLALAVHRGEFQAGEVLYQMYDVAWSIYLVLAGTFAHVALPGPNGGVDQEQILMPNVSARKSVRTINKEEQSEARTPVRRISDWVQMATSVEREAQVNSSEPQRLYPYQLFSTNDYVGEVEVIQGKPRAATLRCESAGTALVLRKESFVQLQEEFPRFGDWWRKAALKNEQIRRRRLEKLTHGLTYKHLAAVRIQRWILPRLLDTCSSRAKAARSRHRRGSSFSSRPSLIPEAAQHVAPMPTLLATASPTSPGKAQAGHAVSSDRQMEGASPPLLRELAQMRQLMQGMRSSMDALRGDLDSLRREVRTKPMTLDQVADNDEPTVRGPGSHVSI